MFRYHAQPEYEHLLTVKLQEDINSDDFEAMISSNIKTRTREETGGKTSTQKSKEMPVERCLVLTVAQWKILVR